MADNERLVGQDTQLAQIEQARNWVGTGYPSDGGALIVRSAITDLEMRYTSKAAHADHVPWLAAAHRVALTRPAAATRDAQRERLVGRVSRRHVMPATVIGGAV